MDQAAVFCARSVEEGLIAETHCRKPRRNGPAKRSVLSEEFFARYSRAFHQSFELGPHYRCRHAFDHVELRESTIRPGDYILRTDDVRVTNDPVGDNPGMLNGDRVMSDDSRDQDLARWQPAILPNAPFVFMPGVGGLNRIGSSTDLRGTSPTFRAARRAYMRNVPASEAHVIPHTILGNAAKGVIHCIDSQLRPLAVAFGALLDQMIVHVGQHSVVHLKKQARFVDLEIAFLTLSASASAKMYSFLRGVVTRLRRHKAVLAGATAAGSKSIRRP